MPSQERRVRERGQSWPGSALEIASCRTPPSWILTNSSLGFGNCFSAVWDVWEASLIMRSFRLFCVLTCRLYIFPGNDSMHSVTLPDICSFLTVLLTEKTTMLWGPLLPHRTCSSLFSALTLSSLFRVNFAVFRATSFYRFVTHISTHAFKIRWFQPKARPAGSAPEPTTYHNVAMGSSCSKSKENACTFSPFGRCWLEWLLLDTNILG